MFYFFGTGFHAFCTRTLARREIGGPRDYRSTHLFQVLGVKGAATSQRYLQSCKAVSCCKAVNNMRLSRLLGVALVASVASLRRLEGECVDDPDWYYSGKPGKNLLLANGALLAPCRRWIGKCKCARP